jgi:hypothetical protein
VGAHVVEGPGQEEGLFGQVVGLALQDVLEGRDGVTDRDVATGPPGEHLGHEERLAHEALQAACPGDRLLVLLGQLVHAQDGDDVLEVAVLLQDPLRLAGDLVMLLPDDERVEDPRGGRQRVYGRVDAELGDAPLQADGGVEVGEGGGRSWVRVVVGRHEDCLEGGDRAVGG